MTHRKVFVFFLIVTILAGFYLADRYYTQRKAVRYPGFGIEVPAGYTTHGIDVSRYQRDIDWALVNDMRDRGQRISFVFIKATEGLTLEDPRFRKNWREVADYPMLRGAYHYFRPNRDGAAQARFFISKVKLLPGDLPPVVDIEETGRRSPDQIRKALRECLDALEQHYKVKPILYTGVDYYERYLGEAFDVYPLWAAHYEQKDAPRIGRRWLIWQHNCRGNVDGIRGEVDFNVVNGSLFALQDLCIR